MQRNAEVDLALDPFCQDLDQFNPFEEEENVSGAANIDLSELF